MDDCCLCNRICGIHGPVWLVNYPVIKGSAWNVLGAALSSGWSIFLIAAVLCFVVYFGYKYYLSHKKLSVVIGRTCIMKIQVLVLLRGGGRIYGRLC